MKETFQFSNTEMITGVVSSELMNTLEEKLARETLMHGVFLNIHGKGVIIKGDSGIGKSEIALELVKRGHLLVADDAVELYRIGQKIVGKAPAVLANLLEIRGIGVIDVSKMFGISAILDRNDVDLVIQLERWVPSREYTRVGVEENDISEDVLGIKIPKIVVPVSSGRSMSVIIEAAVMNMRLRDVGIDSSKEFVERILKNIDHNKQNNDFSLSFNTFIEIGPLSIQWYAVCILTGAAIAYFLGQYHFKKLGYSKEILSDYVFGLLFVGIIGARIWYVIFMWNELYANNPMEIIMINHGGLAIQGGVITGLIYSYFFFKKRNISFLVAGDAIMPGVLIAQACGRWGNFFNQEAYGSAVDLSFLKALHLPQFIIDKMYIHGQYYQPTFLYESLGCVIGFLIIFFIIRKYQQKQGIQFFTYFIWYGVIRFFIEAFRTDSLYVFGLKTAQLVSIVFFIVGLIGFIYCHFKGQDVLEER